MTTAADTETPLDRLIAALADPGHLFTAEQVAFLMGTAARWAREAVEDEPSPESYAAGFEAGYRSRVDEENAAYPPPPIFVAGEWVRAAERVAARRAADTRRRRRSDHRRGPVREWGPSWCGLRDTDDGDPTPHRPHIAEEAVGDGDRAEEVRFKCEGRRPW